MTPRPRARADAVSSAELHPAVEASGAERARLVRGLFGRVARRYDLVNRVASAGIDRRWRAATVRELRLRPGDEVLDACCGTGDLSAALRRAGARVTGVDFCRPMLAEAALKPECRDVSFLEADALALPFPAASFDAACVAFGARNLADPDAGLTELVRCVRPGGRVAVLEFSQPRPAWLAAAYSLYCRRVLPWIGDRLSGAPGTYKYLPQTIGRWPGPEDLAGRLEALGLENVRWRRLTFGIAALHVGIVKGVESPC